MYQYTHVIYSNLVPGRKGVIIVMEQRYHKTSKNKHAHVHKHMQRNIQVGGKNKLIASIFHPQQQDFQQQQQQIFQFETKRRQAIALDDVSQINE